MHIDASKLGSTNFVMECDTLSRMWVRVDFMVWEDYVIIKAGRMATLVLPQALSGSRGRDKIDPPLSFPPRYSLLRLATLVQFSHSRR